MRLAEPSPEPELFDEVSEYAGQIEKMRESALLTKAASAMEAQIDQFAALMKEASAHTPWLANHTEEILSDWAKAYAEVPGAAMGDLQTALDLAAQELSAHAQAWADATKKKDQARLSLHALENAEDDQLSSPEDRELKEDEYHAEIAKLGQQARKSRDRILVALRPPHPAGHAPVEASADFDVGSSQSDSGSKQVAFPTGSSQRESESPPPTDDISVAPSSGDSQSAEHVPAPALDPASAEQEEPAPLLESANQEWVEAPVEASESFDKEEQAVWTALWKGRPGLAQRIARLNEAVEGTIGHPSPDLLAAVALGSQISSSDEEIVQEFGLRKGAVLSHLDFGAVDEETKDALNLLVVSGSLRPALFAPQQTDAIALLRRVELSSELASVYRFATAIADNAETLQGTQFDSSTLAAVFDEGGWKDRLESHVGQVDQWRSSPAPSFPLRAAEHVWRHWMSKGVLAELMGLVCNDNIASVQRVREIIVLLSTQKSMRTHFDRTRRNDLGHTVRKGVSGDVLTQMERHLDDPINLAQNWLQLVEDKVGGGGWQKDTVANLCDDIRNYGKTALASLRRVKASDYGLPLRAATECVIEVIETLGNHRLHEKGFDDAAAVSAAELLSDDLVHVIPLSLDEFGEIDADIPDAVALSLIVDGEKHAESFVAAFKARIANDDLLGAWVAWTRLSRQDDPDEADCRTRLDVAVAAKVRALRHDLYDISHKLEQSFFMGQVDLEEYGALNDSIANARESLDKDDAQVLAAIKSSRGIAETVERIFRTCIEKAKGQLSVHRDRLDAEQNGLVEAALRAEDLTLLGEYIGCLTDGRPLAAAEKDECASLKAFLAVLDGIVDEREGREGLAQGKIVEQIKQRKDILGLAFSSLSPAQADRSAAMIEAWYLIEREPPETLARLLDFTEMLGFAPKDVKKERGGKGNVFALSTEALRNRALCPVHSFGSTADGHYRIIRNDKAPVRNHIIQAVGSDPNRPRSSSTLARFPATTGSGCAVGPSKTRFHSSCSTKRLSCIWHRCPPTRWGRCLTVRFPLPASSRFLPLPDRCPQNRSSDAKPNAAASWIATEVVSSTAGANWGRPPFCIARRLHFTTQTPGGSPTIST